MIVTTWERERAQRVADITRRVILEGIEGNDFIYQQLSPSQLPPPEVTDPNIRAGAYGLLAGLDIVEPWQRISQVGAFSNNWVDLGDAFNNFFSVHMMPGGKVHWRGLIGRSTGSASNGETICSFPAKYAPKKFLGYPCITNSGGVIHIGIFPNGTMTWRTTGGFTGGYAYVYADDIVPYDTRD